MKLREATYTNQHGIEFTFYATVDGYAFKRNPDKYGDGREPWPTKDLTAMFKWLDGIKY